MNDIIFEALKLLIMVCVAVIARYVIPGLKAESSRIRWQPSKRWLHRPYYTRSRYSHQRVEPRKKLLLLTC